MLSPQPVLNIYRIKVTNTRTARSVTFSFFKDFNLFIYKEGKGGKKKGKHQYVVVSWAPVTADLAHNQGMYPDWESNQQPFYLQAGMQSTEPHQLGLNVSHSKSPLSI